MKSLDQIVAAVMDGAVVVVLVDLFHYELTCVPRKISKY
jgi:hypothetical protein